MTPREPERTPAVDSETWTCAGPCHGQFIGARPADDTCAQCTVLAVTTAPAWLPTAAELESGSLAARARALTEQFENDDLGALVVGNRALSEWIIDAHAVLREVSRG